MIVRNVVSSRIRSHVTGSEGSPRIVEKQVEEKGGVASEAVTSGFTPAGRMERFGGAAYGRPVMGRVVQEYVTEGKTMLFGCGPESLRNDLANACAAVQGRTMKGEVQEVAMHLEAFGW